VAATAPGFDRVEQPLSIAEGERREVVLTLTASTAPPSPPPPPSERGLSTWAWVGGGIAAAGLVVGSITGGLSLAAAAAAKEGCKGNVCPKANEPDADRSLALAHTSTASFVLAAAGGGLLVYGLVFDRPEPVQKRAARLRTRPLVGPGWVGLDAAF
jgi:hypothetical protein